MVEGRFMISLDEFMKMSFEQQMDHLTDGFGYSSRRFRRESVMESHTTLSDVYISSVPYYNGFKKPYKTDLNSGYLDVYIYGKPVLRYSEGLNNTGYHPDEDMLKIYRYLYMNPTHINFTVYNVPPKVIQSFNQILLHEPIPNLYYCEPDRCTEALQYKSGFCSGEGTLYAQVMYE